MIANPQHILVWLPSPLGDAIMATPALSSIRQQFPSAKIMFLTSRTNRAFLEPSAFCDDWMDLDKSYFRMLGKLRQSHYDLAVLFKNSFGSALTTKLAGIPERVGYAREGRNWMLTDRLMPEKENGDFKPVSAVDYYLNVAQYLGGTIANKKLSIGLTDADRQILAESWPQLNTMTGPLVILVPGGAFGPSKLWPVQRFAELADRLIETCRATVVISIAPTPQEIAIAEQIQGNAKQPILSLGQRPLKPGPLKALYEKANLVITNDTGPRHIAAALDRKLITLFGPNNPAWTETHNPNEIQIVGQSPCAPCDKPRCIEKEHYCMLSISVEQVYNRARSVLGMSVS
ncbi:MAG: lipopolysaccharide heptosyltransferase II [Sedimentisphaerales bacterium]|nr:lipopolysaccharide heptosyltransferase II [Sedimentisphaerales bacterium]